jgi:riboflavin kinase/FMN adenylyltransferase
VLPTLKSIAQEKSLASCVVSFWPHPRVILGNAHQLKLLTDLSEKQILMEEFGIDYFVILTFTREFATLESERFFEDILIKRIRAAHLVVGYDHHFGRNRGMNADGIQKLAESKGVGFTKVEAFSDYGQHASSTLIRRALENGEIEKANDLLGYSYRMRGEVRDGMKIGRTLGFPTANVYFSEEKLIPANAVYGVEVREGGNKYFGLMNIGYRPTISESTYRVCEVHILKFKGDLYGKTVELRILSKIRDEFHFSSRESLKAQIKLDVELFKRWLKKRSAL